MDNSYFRFLNKQSAFPQFKKRGSRECKLHLPQFFKVERLSRNYGQVHLPKMTQPLKFYWTKAVPSNPKTCIISIKNGRIYVSFKGEKYTNKIAPKNTQIGIDVGCNVSAATSVPIDGKRLHNIETSEIKLLETLIANLQRKQSTKVKFSSRWCKLQKQINQNYTKISNIRHDFHHKLTTKIAKNHSNLFREDLDVQKMMENISGTIENPGEGVAKKTGLLTARPEPGKT